MSNNKNLIKAKTIKNDEFYTQLSDIEKELEHYKKYFENSVIYCNCDNPKHSNFWKFFFTHFTRLKIKKIISTYYVSDGVSYLYEYDGRNLSRQELRGRGDFRDDELSDVLKEADIVVTNPPFSLFREYVSKMIDNNKRFIIMGSQNALTYKEVFPLFREGKIRLGVNNGAFLFNVPKDYETNDVKTREDGSRYTRIGNIAWFTNLDIENKKCDMKLTKTYSEEKYPKYENYNAINIDRLVDIPKDYYGVMGVPITFIAKHNPKEFKIIGITDTYDKAPEVERLRLDKKNRRRGIINGREKYVRVFVKRIGKSMNI